MVFKTICLIQSIQMMKYCDFSMEKKKQNTFLSIFGFVHLFVFNYLSFQKQLQMQNYSPSPVITDAPLAINYTTSEMQRWIL